MWRVRLVLSLVTAYFLWTAVFGQHQELFGYTRDKMLAYIFISWVIQSLVLSSRSIDLAGIINSGDLSNILIKPLSNLKYWFFRDIADKALNLLFSAGELAVLFLILRPAIEWPSLVNLGILAIFVLPLATILYYFINYLFGLFGFWTPQVWAPRFLLFVILQFVAGSLFPLDVLPVGLQRVLDWTPFPYLIYFPTQVFLERIGEIGIIKGIVVTAVWMAIFYLIVKLVWKKGILIYSAEGR